ncbi:DUF4652 domain-containing protein [Clostridium sp.]|uniref:DUF4652 domain-containing protein n=1 Tax=Clostridium sp. TaxID=1506 RepID=UPI001A5749A3|nr:DUF4652 domain-containing protein [Clostridium sp.]MBK5240838.1 DUF4652 domain-containing protein [Clostridium sp.]
MNCNIFKKRLEDYVLGNISNDLKIALENHMDGCESCRMMYEEESSIDSSFKMALAIEGIEFNSSRTNIINAIDKNRYSKKTSNKVLYNFKRYKNKYLSYAAAVIAMIAFIPMLLNNFYGGSYKSEDAIQNKVAMYKAEERSGEGTSMEESIQDITKEDNPPMEFKSIVVSTKELPTYEMVWENSLDGKKSAVIDTMKEQDVDFGIHAIYVKDIKTNEIVKYEVINDSLSTTRNIEWWDNENLIVVTGFAYGTVAKGSDVYSLEVNTGEFTTLYQVKDQKQQIVTAEKVKNDLILQLLIYEDDNYNISHKAVGKMTLLEPSKPVDMQIVSEEKK